MATEGNQDPEQRSSTGKANLESLKERMERARLAKEEAERRAQAGDAPADEAPAAPGAAPMDIRPRTESLRKLQGMSEKLAERKRQQAAAGGAGEAASDDVAPPAPYVPKSYYEPKPATPVPEGAPSSATAAAASEVREHAARALQEHPGVVISFALLFLLVLLAEIATWPTGSGGLFDLGDGSGGAGKQYEVELADLAVMVTATDAAGAGIDWPDDHDIDEARATSEKVKLPDGSYQTSYAYHCLPDESGEPDEYGEYEDFGGFDGFSGAIEHVESDVLYCKKDKIAEEWYTQWSDHYRGRGDWGGGAIETRNDQFRWGDESFWGVIVDDSGVTTFFVGRHGRRVFRMSIQNANLQGNELERLISPQLDRLESYKP